MTARTGLCSPLGLLHAAERGEEGVPDFELLCGRFELRDKLVIDRSVNVDPRPGTARLAVVQAESLSTAQAD